VRIIRESSEDEMVACFLLGELTSPRFGEGIRRALAAAGASEGLLTAADLTDQAANRVRRGLLTATRGYGENRDVFEDFPGRVRWIRAVLTPEELACVRYIEYSYWNELSGGSRLPGDAAERIRRGIRVFGVSNGRFIAAARAVRRGERFAPLILAGPRPDSLVCLEGHLRLTAYALAGFPLAVECLVGTAEALDRWAR
jgi:pimeloyl-ACP methyl ester carboxylesterase